MRNVRARLARLERLEGQPTAPVTVWDLLSGSLPADFELTEEEEADILAQLGQPTAPAESVEERMARILGDPAP